jgi:hypothetical protein
VNWKIEKCLAMLDELDSVAWMTEISNRAAGFWGWGLFISAHLFDFVLGAYGLTLTVSVVNSF